MKVGFRSIGRTSCVTDILPVSDPDHARYGQVITFRTFLLEKPPLDEALLTLRSI